MLIQENAFQNVVCEMAAILASGRWVDTNFAKPSPSITPTQVSSHFEIIHGAWQSPSAHFQNE